MEYGKGMQVRSGNALDSRLRVFGFAAPKPFLSFFFMALPLSALDNLSDECARFAARILRPAG